MTGSPPDDTAHRFRYPRTRRIARSEEIRALMRRGKRSRTTHLDVFHSASPAPHPRAGVVVPRYRRAVVERNRLKRRLREVLRQDVMVLLASSSVPLDVLVRARPDAYQAGFQELRQELLEWVHRHLARGG
jgi:ribonuclease P protein component